MRGKRILPLLQDQRFLSKTDHHHHLRHKDEGCLIPEEWKTHFPPKKEPENWPTFFLLSLIPFSLESIFGKSPWKFFLERDKMKCGSLLFRLLYKIKAILGCSFEITISKFKTEGKCCNIKPISRNEIFLYPPLSNFCGFFGGKWFQISFLASDVFPPLMDFHFSFICDVDFPFSSF